MDWLDKIFSDVQTTATTSITTATKRTLDQALGNTGTQLQPYQGAPAGPVDDESSAMPAYLIPVGIVSLVALFILKRKKAA